MALDSEMQSAADEAALAAATQLDGRAGAITRARDAVNSYFANSNSNVVNRTLLANDGGGSALTGVTFTFYTSFNSSTDTFGAVATTDASAKVVEVGNQRPAGLLCLHPDRWRIRFGQHHRRCGCWAASGDLQDPADDGLQTDRRRFSDRRRCRQGAVAATRLGRNVGTGHVRLSRFWSRRRHSAGPSGSNGGIDECTSGADVQAQQGNIASAPKYLNTRFDMYENPLTPTDCAGNGDKCPAANTRKDLVRIETHRFKNVPQGTFAEARPSCSSSLASTNSGANPVITVGDDWIPLPATSLPATSQIQGFPRDNCHNTGSSNSTGTCAAGTMAMKSGTCQGLEAAHPTVPSGLLTRYAIYQWERDNPGSGLQPLLANADDPATEGSCSGPAANRRCDYTWTNYCAYPSPIKGTYNATPKDRRLLTVAVVDCSADTGGGHVFPVDRWMDVFLTEPSWDRDVPFTRASQIYSEVVGLATKPDGTNAFQFFGRQKAVLLQ